jgi:tetratricopeptide (TPR) repeat protein
LTRFVPPHCVIHYCDRGISLFYKEKYTDAAGYFEKVLGLDCFNVVATNNLALCHLHLGSVTKAIEIIEDIMFSDPDKTLHEVVVYNLCTFYDLVTEKSLDKRKKILQLVRDHAPDNFNLGSLKLSS